MADTGKRPPHELPTYLKPLLEPTPSSIAKLLAVWDGLSTERHLEILGLYEHLETYPFLRDRVYRKALESDNAYVRYLAAKHLYRSCEPSQEQTGINKQIAEDRDPLVRYSYLERSLGIIGDRDLDDPVQFFALPHAARLAKVQGLWRPGEILANLVRHAVEHELRTGKVSENELAEILLDCVAKPAFRETHALNLGSYDGYGEYSKGTSVVALWHLVPDVPSFMSYILLHYLPESAGLQTGIPPEVLERMTDAQLEVLLSRRDITLEGLRKRLFFDGATQQTRDCPSGLFSAAISYNFDLTYEEFAVILNRPEEERARFLNNLCFAYDLSLCLRQAIHDLLLHYDWSDMRCSGGAEWAKRSLEDGLERVRREASARKKKEVNEWRLYQLARIAVPWKQDREAYPPEEDLGFLAEHIHKGDTWATFTAFSRAWAEDWQRIKKQGLEEVIERLFPIDHES